jgi:hypothetical protein
VIRLIATATEKKIHMARAGLIFFLISNQMYRIAINTFSTVTAYTENSFILYFASQISAKINFLFSIACRKRIFLITDQEKNI